MVELFDKLQGMLDSKDLEPKTKQSGIRKKMPSHVGFSMAGSVVWSKKKKVSLAEAYKKTFEVTQDLIKLQVKRNIPIFTLYLLTEDMRKSEYFGTFSDELVSFFESIKDDKFIHQNQIRISVLGKWYDLSGRIVEPIKAATEATREYDRFFLNLCVNYDGQEEIVDAAKLIARRIKAERIDVDQITKQELKENIYSSYFLPPT